MLTLLTNLPRDVLIRQLQDGLVLLVLGMGFVFIFLAILVFTTKWISRLCMKVAPAKQPEVKKAPAQAATAGVKSAGGAKDAEIAAAIAAAYAKSKN